MSSVSVSKLYSAFCLSALITQSLDCRLRRLQSVCLCLSVCLYTSCVCCFCVGLSASEAPNNDLLPHEAAAAAVSPCLSLSPLLQVLGLADHYTLSTLKRYCENVLCGCLDPATVCCLLRCAERYQAKQLKESCVEFLFRHSDVVAQTPQFEQLQSDPSLVMEIAKMSLSNQRKHSAAAAAAPHDTPDNVVGRH